MPSTTDHRDVTVVIPCFNYGQFLERAIDSATAQAGGVPGIVVVDDGSTDEQTLEVLDRLPDHVVLVRQANQGLSAARNTGFRACDTPLVIALDADDELPPHALNALKEGLRRDPTAGYAYGVTRHIGDLEGEVDMPEWDPYRLLFRHTIGPTALTRRELFEDVGGYDPEMRRYEDWEFWLRAVSRGWHGVKVPEVTFLYRRHGPSMLADARRSHREWYRRIRSKHPSLYARRREFARQTSLGAAGRMVYRLYWGPRPIPARVEARLYALLWNPKAPVILQLVRRVRSRH